jgi:hypothetical protein
MMSRSENGMDGMDDKLLQLQSVFYTCLQQQNLPVMVMAHLIPWIEPVC